MFEMNRAWQKVEELQQSWAARERELVGQVDQAKAKEAGIEKALVEAQKAIEKGNMKLKETVFKWDCNKKLADNNFEMVSNLQTNLKAETTRCEQLDA